MFLEDVARGKGLAPSLSLLSAVVPACRWEAPASDPFLWLTLVPPTILTYLGKKPYQLKASSQPFTAFSVSVLQVVIRRRPLFYTVSLLLPSIFLMVMDIVGFYLPPHSGERVSFKITLLLGYSVFLIIVSDTLPATAVGTPLIGTVVLRTHPTATAVMAETTGPWELSREDLLGPVLCARAFAGHSPP